jgi:hypothetical protein
VLIGVDWLTAVNWDRRSVSVEMTREAVRNAPEWRPEAVIDRDLESRLYDYYGRQGYWHRPHERIWRYAA